MSNTLIIAGYLLPRPTPAPALMRELHWHRICAEEPGYVTGNHEGAAADRVVAVNQPCV